MLLIKGFLIFSALEKDITFGIWGKIHLYFSLHIISRCITGCLLALYNGGLLFPTVPLHLSDVI